jgi:hypothetical protein
MGAQTVAALIARLDAISRARSLTAAESNQLSKLITTYRRYQYGQREGLRRRSEERAARQIPGSTEENRDNGQER